MASAGGLLGPPLARLVADAESLLGEVVIHGDGGESTTSCTNAFANPCLQLFLAKPNTPVKLLRDLLAAAWAQDPLTALKLVANIRGLRNLGRGDRESFYTAALWIHSNHPETLAANIPVLAEFGYLKDFPELLYRLVRGEDVRKLAKAKSMAKGFIGSPKLGSRKRKRAADADAASHPPTTAAVPPEHVLVAMATFDQQKASPKVPNLAELDSDQEMEVEAPSPKVSTLDDLQPKEVETPSPKVAILDDQQTKEVEAPSPNVSKLKATEAPSPNVFNLDDQQAKEVTSFYGQQHAAYTELKNDDQEKNKILPSKKLLKTANLAAQALAKHKNDAAYRFLFEAVADFFAKCLASDLKHHAAGKLEKIGLAAKWCPSLDSSFQQATLLCEEIARRLFPRECTSEYMELPEPAYAFRVIRRLRREVLVPLRAALRIPEPFMSRNEWSVLPYSRVASEAMKRYHSLFMKHDGERFTKYLEGAKVGKAEAPMFRATTMLGELSLHHQIISEPSQWRRQAKWRQFVTSRRDKGLFCNCMAICDVFNDTPELDVCLAITLLILELGEHPWNNTLISFSEDPREMSISMRGNLGERLGRIKDTRLRCEGTINLRKVLELVYCNAELSKVSPEKMVRTIYIFTNKTLSQASLRPWRKDYKIMCDKFAYLGYGDVMPQIVFWNIQGPRSASLTSSRDGILSLSGFSDEFLRLFLDKGGIVCQEDEMEDSIRGPHYDKLVIVD